MERLGKLQSVIHETNFGRFYMIETFFPEMFNATEMYLPPAKTFHLYVDLLILLHAFHLLS